MKNAALFIFALSALFTLPGHAGGWVTSGQRRAAPVENIPVAGPFKISCGFDVVSSKDDEGMSLSEEFTDQQFVNGRMLFTTPRMPRKSYLGGHQISLSLFQSRYSSEQFLRLSIDGILQNKNNSVHATNTVQVKRGERAEASVSLRSVRPGIVETLYLSVSCSEVR